MAVDQKNFKTHCLKEEKKPIFRGTKFFNLQKNYPKVKIKTWKKKLEETRKEIFFIIIEIREFTKLNFSRPKKLRFFKDPVSRINRLMMIIFHVNELQTISF